MAGANGRPIAELLTTADAAPPAATIAAARNRGTLPDTTFSDDPIDGPADDRPSEVDPSTAGLGEVPVEDDDNYVYLPPESSLARRILWVVGGVVVFFALILAVGGWWVMKQVNPGSPGEAVTVTVPTGQHDRADRQLARARRRHHERDGLPVLRQVAATRGRSKPASTTACSRTHP